MRAWEDFEETGKKFSRTNVNALEKYDKLSETNQYRVLKFSDKPGNSTLAQFFDVVNDDVVDGLNRYEELMEAIVGHKAGFSSADYENTAEVLDDIEDLNSSTKAFMEEWIERSAGFANFSGAARLGNELSENILNSILRNSRITGLIQSKLGINLNGYVLFKEVAVEVPITSNTPGGFMKADAVLIKYDDFGEIEDIVIIENKLRTTTNFTPAQLYKFNEVKNAVDGSFTDFVVKYARTSSDGSKTLNPDNILKVARNRVLKISDTGTNNIDMINLEDVQLIKDLNF